MKKYLSYLIVFLLITSCNESLKSKTNKNDTDIENFSMEEMPNKNTKYDTIYTVNSTDNIKLIYELKTKLEKADFTFEERKNRGGFSYNNCEENSVKLIRGNGIREYFARSKKPEKGTKDFYPDFIILVYEFPTNAIAKQNYEILNKALNSGGRFCNGKSPEKLVFNRNEVFYLGTRAEMFRTYTEKYGEIIKNYR
ncbi:hypothetical protein [Flavobacterium croceum]|mgnify:FL=1|uniref:hypothetical protein n=1 Tax=Flavobacterium croceum TaxID=370975 RepID=UPI0024A9FFF3|nr:hypothetical protein [Flavobacterium croceum]